MKKRILSIILTLSVMLGCMPLVLQEVNAEETGKKITEYDTGNTLEYGWYPQSKVTDSTTISKLDAVTKSWISYGYYSGTGNGDDGNMAPSDYMKYCDITLDGNKYRAVTFSKYRKWNTGYTADTSSSKTNDNGYYINNVYYFKYEPLKWRVLDAGTGLVVCDSAIDSQAYNNYVLYSGSYYYGDSAKTHYASDWEHSSLRAWLNDDFLNTAFTSGQQSRIKEVTRENKSTYGSTYDGNPTSDKITLLSYWDVLNTGYGFSSSYNTYDIARQRKSTDYAQCQGCYTEGISSYSENSWWWLRLPSNPYTATEVCTDGSVYYNYFSVADTDRGVVPAFNFDPTSAIIQCTVTDIGYTKRTVTLNPNGGTINSGNVTEYDIGTGATLPTDVTKEGGYAFGGWYDNENLTGDPVTAIGTTEKNNKEYWAKWIDNENPVISGIENGKTYCSAQTVTVTDNGTVRSVTVNGSDVTIDNDGKFTLNPAAGEQEIIVKDTDGNTATMKVTVNNGHEGGRATCKDQAVCEHCGEKYGELNGSNHAGGTEIRNAKDAKCTEDGYTGDTYCRGCETKLQDGKPVTKLGHTDADKNHVCDRENCKATISGCSGGTATCKDKAVCDYCGKPYGEVDPDNHAGELTWAIDGKTHEQKWDCCGEIVVKNEKHSFLWGTCEDCGYVSNFRIVFCLCRAVWYVVQLFDSGIGHVAGWIGSLF